MNLNVQILLHSKPVCLPERLMWARPAAGRDNRVVEK